ncbi:hypothetical protein RhiJN_05834 [Ceratobasidium sp. AG-Ba]|nr:hypothetical protein RhiJN_05834 [Ceratobasidium sp. AG-Ba]QRW06761.1 hypothetical protein RhiLY_05760 [Ceratobasidium sp. AG-Ba]
MPAMSFSPEGSSPAIMEQRDIIVTLATYSKKDHGHAPLSSYEYRGDDVGKNEVACWVPVPIVRRRFCVHVAYEGKSLPCPGAGLMAAVYIDGDAGSETRTYIPAEDILKRIEAIKKGKPRETGEMELRGRESDDGTIRPFTFEPRETTADGI